MAGYCYAVYRSVAGWMACKITRETPIIARDYALKWGGSTICFNLKEAAKVANGGTIKVLYWAPRNDTKCAKCGPEHSGCGGCWD